MSDESEFTPFTLSDFTVEDSTEEVEPNLTPEQAEEEGFEERFQNFKPLSFPAEGEGPDDNDEADFDSYNKMETDVVDKRTDEEIVEISDGYNSTEFVREDSLLTNAETYAETIKQGAQLYKTQLLSSIEETATDTERIHQETVAANQAAERERHQLMEQTQQQVDEIKNAAYQEGYETGLTQGMQQRYEEAGPLVEQVNGVLDQLRSLRQLVRFQAEQELVQLALSIAKNLVIEELKTNPQVIQNIVQSALHEIEVHGKIYVFLNQDDYDFLAQSKADLESYLSDEQTLVLRQDPDVPPGAIHIESDEEVINRTFAEQFEHLEKVLSDTLAERHASLGLVDMDAHDFPALPSEDSMPSMEQMENRSMQSEELSQELPMEAPALEKNMSMQSEELSMEAPELEAMPMDAEDVPLETTDQ